MSYQEIATGNRAGFAWGHLPQPAVHDAARTTHPRTSSGSSTAEPWRTRAIAANQQTEPDAIATLRAELAIRIRSLTGCTTELESIAVDPDTRTATAVMDGAVFRLVGRDLTLLRPCAYCGTGQFASPAIRSLADLGHALAVWEPLHKDCQPQDPAE
jgi:hypothetical protein